MANAQGGGGSHGSATTVGLMLESDGLNKSFAGKMVLQPFRLEIASGQIHVLLGQNGSGKSTLIKILSGLYEPDDNKAVCLVAGQQLQFGQASSSRDLGIRFVHQDLGLIADATVVDNLSYTQGFLTKLGTIGPRANRARVRAVLDAVGLDVDPDSLVADLSAAQRTGIAVARALGNAGESAKVLVLDEPTATLPDADVEHLHCMLRNTVSSGVGILYVTHHLDEVFRLANQVSVLRDGFLIMAGRVADTDRNSIVRALIGSELEAVQREPRTPGNSAPLEDAVLSVTELNAGIVQEAAFGVRAKEIVGVAGLDGSGRETLLGAVFGSLPRDSGTVAVESVTIPAESPAASTKSGIAYLPLDRKVSGAFLHLTAAENITIVDIGPIWSRMWLHLRDELRIATSWFDRLNIRPGDGAKNEFATFSGGNQQKIIFGKWLSINPRVLLLDEPTQGVDVGAKAEIHRQIISACDDGMAVVVSSTDTEELATLCDRILLMVGGRIVDEMTGGNFTEQEITMRFHQISLHERSG